jgi:hypothetical protein
VTACVARRVQRPGNIGAVAEAERVVQVGNHVPGRRDFAMLNLKWQPELSFGQYRNARINISLSCHDRTSINTWHSSEYLLALLGFGEVLALAMASGLGVRPAIHRWGAGQSALPRILICHRTTPKPKPLYSMRAAARGAR